ncbi:MAG: nitronate monooxygenase [Deltaproteobacteria bacterium]|nr:nitronate monooxygenase [Deltaproteobacteria bacterium]
MLPSSLQGRLSIPAFCAPMFLVSGVELTKAACNQRIIGSFPALNARTTELLDGWLSELKAGLNADAAPYAVNLVVHRTNPRVEADLAILEKHRVPIVVTSLGAVSEVVRKVQSWGGVVFHDVTNAHHAKKAADAGVDGIIAVANGAGGHAGTLNPFALVSEIRTFWSKTLLLAGCMNHGAQVLAAQAMGADLAYLGTRFIGTRESAASEAYKQMLLESRAEDILYTPAVSGVPANFMRPSLEKAGYDMTQLGRPGDVNYGQKLKPVDDEAKAWKTVWSAGQGVGAIRDIPTVAELCERLRSEYAEAKARLGAA